MYFEFVEVLIRDLNETMERVTKYKQKWKKKMPKVWEMKNMQLFIVHLGLFALIPFACKYLMAMVILGYSVRVRHMKDEVSRAEFSVPG